LIGFIGARLAFMPKISELRRESRREQILEAALACFSENGFHQTGMADIVRRSGMSHGAVYVYFSSKDDIIEALADDRLKVKPSSTQWFIRRRTPSRAFMRCSEPTRAG
jgi:AcrR family transcriptional regulator